VSRAAQQFAAARPARLAPTCGSPKGEQQDPIEVAPDVTDWRVSHCILKLERTIVNLENRLEIRTHHQEKTQ